MLINIKMSTFVGILIFISMINTISESLKAREVFIIQYLVFMRRYRKVELRIKKKYL